MLSSIRDEMAVIGFAIDKQEHLERFIAEMTEAHFTEPETEFMYNGIIKIIESGEQVTPSLLAKVVHNREAVREAWVMKDECLAGDAFANVHLFQQRRAYRELAENLMRVTMMNDFDPKMAEKIVTEYTPGNPAEINKKYFIEMPEAVDAVMTDLREQMKNPGTIRGVRLSYEAVKGAAPVGFKSLDNVIKGLNGGDLIMFGAKTGHGKTALAMNLSRIMAFHNGKRVHYLNTEMDEVQMMQRWIAQSTLIPFSRIMEGTVQNYEYEKIEHWAEKFREAPLTISQISALSIDLTVGLAKRALKKYGHLDCLIVDYIGRLDVEHGKGMQEYQMFYENVKRLKETARSLNIPIIVLAQLNDDGKLEGAKKMKNELDFLFFLKPKETKTKDEDGKEITVLSETEYFITKEKCRRSSTEGAIRVDFEKEYQFIREV